MRDRDSAKLDNATAVVSELMAIPAQGIPANLLASAQGIAVIPNRLKAGFIFGAGYGRGVLVRRLPDGSWSDPAFVTLAGGNWGLQVGVESADLVLVFRTARSLNTMQNGKLVLGGEASIAAGPVGRNVKLATTPTLSAEIYSYSRSRGAFIGVALTGSVLTLDQNANMAFYGVPNPIVQRASYTPASARRFDCTLANYTGGPMQACA
jgi:lipid-binding SYLF domain-containing protein